MFALSKNLTAIQPKFTAAGHVGSLQDKTGSAVGDIGNLAVPGAIDGTSLKVVLGKGVNQGLLEVDGANYMVKGHAKKAQSKARSHSKGKKVAGKKASKSKGRKKSAGPKKAAALQKSTAAPKKSAGPKKSAPRQKSAPAPKKSKKGEAAKNL